MGYAVELYFDEKSTQSILQMWKSIDSSLLNLNAQPHISLCLFESLDLQLMDHILKMFAFRYQKITVNLGSLSSFFSDEGVIFLAPVVTQPLLDLHKGFHQMLAAHGIEPHSYYTPGNWVPHCTMEINLPSADLPHKFALCRKLGPVNHVDLESIGLISYPPIREIFRYSLQ